jgi:hypothetical protein
MAMPVSPGVAKLITLLIGTILLAFVVRGIHILRMALASRDWKLTEGLLLDVHMEERRGRDSDGRDDPNLDTFLPVVRYSYTVGRKKFESARLWYRTDALGDYSEALRAIRDIRAGKPVDVYYDPAEPSRSVLIPGFETMNVATVAVSSIAFVLYLIWCISR